jgi:hypothetical protein
MNRPRWTRVTILIDGDNTELDGRERLGALGLWLRREAPSNVVVRDPEGRALSDPMSVDWANFPLQEATDAAPAILSVLNRSAS